MGQGGELRREREGDFHFLHAKLKNRFSRDEMCPQTQLHRSDGAFSTGWGKPNGSSASLRGCGDSEPENAHRPSGENHEALGTDE